MKNEINQGHGHDNQNGWEIKETKDMVAMNKINEYKRKQECNHDDQ